MTATIAPAAVHPQNEWQNLLGVCACIGEDFGFNPIFLRIAFGAGLIWSPVMMISIYLALGAVVLVSRLAAPNRRRGIITASSVEMAAAEDTVELPLAA